MQTKVDQLLQRVMDAYGSANAELLGDLVVELAEVTATLSARLAERVLRFEPIGIVA